MVCSIGNPEGGVLQRASFPTVTPDVTIPQIVDFIGKFDVKALGIGSFGPLDLNPASPTYGSITKTPKTDGIDYPLLSTLQEALGVPTGSDTDVNAAALAEHTMGAGKGLSSLLILPEVKDSDIATIAPTRNGKPVPTGVMIYGHMPLMLTRACPLQNIHDCAHCDKTGVLTDRKAKKFPVRCGLGVRTIYNPVPIYMGDKPGALAVDYGVAYFTLESREEAAQILDSIRTHAPFEGDFTRGLYFKGTN